MSKFVGILLSLFCVFGECECLSQGIEDSANIDFDTPSYTHVFKERNAYLSAMGDTKKQNRARHDHIHEVVFVIQQKNMDELTSILHDISDPYSPNYGRHWTREEVVDFTSNPDGRDAVVSYLHSNGASFVSETLAGEYITARAPIEVWEKILNTEFFLFTLTHHDKSIQNVIRAERYWIPRDLDIYVASVLNTIEIHHQILKSPSKVSLASKIGKFSSTAFGYVTPTKLRDYYNMSTAMGSINSTQAVFATIGQGYSPKLLAAFQQEQGSFVMPVARDYGNHANDTLCIRTDKCHEGMLDVQYIMTMSPKSPTTFWYTDSWFATWLVEVGNSVDPPKVLSFSYITTEIGLTASQHDTFDVAAIKLGTMGVTIVAGSGDDGAGYVGQCGFKPAYPAASPYVLTVGGTMVSRTFAFIRDYSPIDLFIDAI